MKLQAMPFNVTLNYSDLLVKNTRLMYNIVNASECGITNPLQ